MWHDSGIRKGRTGKSERHEQNVYIVSPSEPGANLIVIPKKYDSNETPVIRRFDARLHPRLKKTAEHETKTKKHIYAMKHLLLIATMLVCILA